MAAKYKGSLTFGYGTLEELNQGGRNYPIAWLVMPITVTDSATDSSTARQERYPVVIRFLQSTKNTKDIDEVDNLFIQTKAIGDGFVYSLLGSADFMSMFILGDIAKKQIWKAADDVHVGWEYVFNLDYFPDVDSCCEVYNS